MSSESLLLDAAVQGMDTIARHEHFVSYSASDWRRAAGDVTPFAIEGLVARGVTLLYGQSEAGKSMIGAGIVAAAVSGQGEFLERAVEQRQWQAGILTGDFRDAPRWCERLERVLTPSQMARVSVYDPTRVAMPFDAGWAELAEVTDWEGVNLLVIDNLSTFVPGDINHGPACMQFFDTLVQFTARDITVIVLAHSTEKHGQFGPQDFIGHSAIKQRPSFHVKVRKVDDNHKVLTTHGNDCGDGELSVSMADAATPAFELVGAKGSDQLSEERRGRRRDRDKGTMDLNAEIWGVKDAHPGWSYQRVADEMSGVKGRTVTKRRVQTAMESRKK